MINLIRSSDEAAAIDRHYNAEVNRLSALGYMDVPSRFSAVTAIAVLKILGLTYETLKTPDDKYQPSQVVTTEEGFGVLEIVLLAGELIRSDRGKGEGHNIRAIPFEQIAREFAERNELFREFSAACRLGADKSDLWQILKDGLP